MSKVHLILHTSPLSDLPGSASVSQKLHDVQGPVSAGLKMGSWEPGSFGKQSGELEGSLGLLRWETIHLRGTGLDTGVHKCQHPFVLSLWGYITLGEKWVAIVE